VPELRAEYHELERKYGAQPERQRSGRLVVTLTVAALAVMVIGLPILVVIAVGRR
jgi:heme/copper-type cytochrome/quinol oxidase subunit 2